MPLIRSIGGVLVIGGVTVVGDSPALDDLPIAVDGGAEYRHCPALDDLPIAALVAQSTGTGGAVTGTGGAEYRHWWRSV